MKKMLLAICAVLVLSSPAVAQTSQNVERYYAGIGAKLYKVDKDTLEFSGRRNGQEIRFNNESGEFTGFVFFSEILANGPAGKSGLETGDILLEVDGADIFSLGSEGAMEKITSKSVGERVNLKIGQSDENGNLLRAFNVDIVIERIDRVAWVPLGLDLGGSFCTGDACVSYTSKVFKDKTTGKFSYYYSFSNTHSNPIILQSTILNFLLGKGVDNPPVTLLKMNPMKTVTFMLESDIFPVSGVPSPMREFVSAEDDPNLLKHFQKDYPIANFPDLYRQDSEGQLWLDSSGTSLYLFVPVIWSDFLQQENEKFWKR